jgi:tetratricopeptide (TPR) repeat protein
MRNAGSFNGKHYTEYIEYIKQLKRERKHEEAVKLLLELTDAVEREARMAGKLNRGAPWFIAPWYYKQLAIIYHKEGRYDKEVEILERYCNQTKTPGARVSELEQRLTKAKELRNKQKS